jgi:hypothetical protein
MSVRAFCRPFLLVVFFQCCNQHIAEFLRRYFRPSLSIVLCRECITPTVILLFADFAVLQLFGLVCPCRKHFEDIFIHRAFVAVKDDMHFISMLFCSDTINVLNTDLKNRITDFLANYPNEGRLLDDDEMGCKTFEVKKGRFGFKLTAPYSEELRKAAGELAKKHTKNLRRSEK